MKNPASLARRILVLASFIIGLGAVSQVIAADQPAGQPAGWVAVPSSYKKADIQEAIVSVLQKRKWEVKETADGKVVGYYKHHRNEATVTLTYDDKQISIFCEGYLIDRDTGARKEPRQPESWLKYLREDLSKMLGTRAAAK